MVSLYDYRNITSLLRFETRTTLQGCKDGVSTRISHTRTLLELDGSKEGKPLVSSPFPERRINNPTHSNVCYDEIVNHKGITGSSDTQAVFGKVESKTKGL